MNWNSTKLYVAASLFALLIGGGMIIAGLFMLFGWPIVLIVGGALIVCTVVVTQG